MCNMEKFLSFVAEVFEVDAAEICMETQYKIYEKWDSLKMLVLVMELEAEYEVSIPLESLIKVKTLNDLYKIIDK